MSKRLLALVSGLVAAVLVAASTAAADDSNVGVQTADQSAASGQQATAVSGATQVQPSNTNISVRVLSPGNDGSVTQANTVGSSATAANLNGTSQDADQTQAGSGTGIQTADQSASNAQLAGAFSLATQYGASNTNVPVRVGSYGSSGDVTQINAAGSEATAANVNGTKQDADQTQAGGHNPCNPCSDGSTGIQTVDQDADSKQVAAAKSATFQLKPTNVNTAVRVGSPGDGGDVYQANVASSEAKAANANATSQDADQTQAGSGDGIQTADQSAKNHQAAAAESVAVQEKPKNVNISVRVLSPGNDGDVKQINAVDSSATAANLNATKQDADQTQLGGKGGKACGCDSSTGIQTVDQSAKSAQAAHAESAAFQKGAENVNTPIRVGSYGHGGDVTQVNSVSSDAAALNANATKQDADQLQKDGASHCCKHDSTGIQTVDQSSLNLQAAGAASTAKQYDAENTNSPLRVGSKGHDGDVTQINAVDSTAVAANLNATHQDADQTQWGGGGALGIQTVYQGAGSAQLAHSGSAAIQSGASNDNSPLRVGSSGGGGSVTQANLAESTAKSLNANLTKQDADQVQKGDRHDCKCADGIGIQALGQKAVNLQGASATSLTVQEFGKGHHCRCDKDGNSNSPVRVGSKGHDGDVTQVNAASSTAHAGNLNATLQDGSQWQLGGSGIGIQALGQQAVNLQDAEAWSAALQAGASNENAPIRVKSPGGGGSVLQANEATSTGIAGNANLTAQLATQMQLGPHGRGCRCDHGLGIQALGQDAKNLQGAKAASATFQLKPSNENGGHAVWSYGSGGSVTQLNTAASLAAALNANKLVQLARQLQA